MPPSAGRIIAAPAEAEVTAVGDPTRVAVIAALEALVREGCPVASTDRHERLADVGLRRWRSFKRRHGAGRSATYDNRICDLTRGLIAAFESDQSIVGPLIKDYECVAEAIASVASGASSS